MTSPKIGALITASGGIGSHFVLHKMHGHPNIMVLNESSFTIDSDLANKGTTKGDLKNCLASKNFSDISANLENEQLFPKKKLDDNIDWVILNKPPLKRINYQRTFNPYIPVNYIFRNPVSFYYTWIKKWKDYGDKRYGKNISNESVFQWFKNTFMTSLFELSQNFDEQRDNIVSFEHFFNDVDSEIERIFDTLGVNVLRSDQLANLDYCRHCGRKDIETRKIKVRGERIEEVLYCPDHGPILGPGEHNYIRKENGSFINKWKSNSDCQQVCDEFAEFFGDNLIEYYYDEKYLVDKDRAIYDNLIREFMNGLKL